jgi:drug/metabolite transporter (DMT)-like permease
MAVVVGVARLVQARPLEQISLEGWTAILLLAVFPTAVARLLTFAGLRRLGGIQSSLLSIGEVLVALTFAFFWLGERFTLVQWIGAGMFVASALLIARDTSLQIADDETWWQSLFPEVPADSPRVKPET